MPDSSRAVHCEVGGQTGDAASRARATRVTLPPVETMTEEQRSLYDGTIAYFGKPTGSRVIFLEVPELGQAWRELLTALETSALPRNLWELTILTVAREWNSQFEWNGHEEAALKAGLSPDVIAAIKAGQQPRFERESEATVYAYITELYRNRYVSDETYERVRATIGQRQLIELTVLFGHYNNIAIQLAAHDVKLPDGVTPPLPALCR